MTKADLDYNESEFIAIYQTLAKAAIETGKIRFKELQRIAWQIRTQGGEPVRLNPYETAAINFGRYVQIISSSASDLLKENPLPELFKEFPDLSRDELPHLKNVFAYIRQQRLSFSAKGSQDLKTRFGKENGKQAVLELVSTTLQLREQVKANPKLEFISRYPGFSNEEEELKRIALRAETQRLSPADLNALLLLSLSYKVFNEMTQDPDLMRSLTAKEFRQETYLELAMNRPLIEYLTQDDPKDRNSILFSLQDFRRKRPCDTLMKTLFLTTPSEKRLTAFKAQMVRMQEALFHELEPHLSADAVKQLREKPKEWEFVLPNSREKQIQLLKREIEQALNETKKDSQTQLAPQSAFERAIELVHFAHLKHRQSRIGALCASFATDIPGDFVSENRIQVSPLTVQLKDHKAAFYHELMHLALKALSGPDADEQTRQWVAKTQECLRENHAEGADEQMINEDFADLVAFSTEAATTTSYICPVTDLQVLTRARTNPFDPFIGSSQSWIYKRSPGDQGYSSSLFRKLHSHVVRGKAIPEACRQVADNEGYEIKLKNCLAR